MSVPATADPTATRAVRRSRAGLIARTALIPRASLILRAALVLCVALALCASGCASAPVWDYAAEPGVPADLHLKDGESLTGTLVELANDSVVFETSVVRGEDVEVIRRDGVDYVYVEGVASGTAVEIRDFDVVTRRSVLLRDTEELVVKSSGYLGWGSVVAGVFAFFLVPILREAQ
jgi:hypothetical protein